MQATLTVRNDPMVDRVHMRYESVLIEAAARSQPGAVFVRCWNATSKQQDSSEGRQVDTHYDEAQLDIDQAKALSAMLLSAIADAEKPKP